MGSRLVVEVQETDDISYVTLVGIIDEDNDLNEVTSRINAKTVVINTANVERINSCGVRDWVNWITEIGEQGARYFFVECSPPIMTQVNSVNNFIGQGAIVSFFAPYYCPSCEKDKILLIATKDALEANPFTTPVCRCDECDQQMEFDELESSFFEFLNSKKMPTVEQELRDKINRYFSSTNKLRTRTGQVPLLSHTPTTPTTPSSKQLRGLLTDAHSLEVNPIPPRQQPATIPKKILYLVVAMLAAAIGLLVYVALRAL